MNEVIWTQTKFKHNELFVNYEHREEQLLCYYSTYIFTSEYLFVSIIIANPAFFSVNRTSDKLKTEIYVNRVHWTWRCRNT